MSCGESFFSFFRNTSSLARLLAGCGTNCLRISSYRLVSASAHCLEHTTLDFGSFRSCLHIEPQTQGIGYDPHARDHQLGWWRERMSSSYFHPNGKKNTPLVPPRRAASSHFVFSHTHDPCFHVLLLIFIDSVRLFSCLAPVGSSGSPNVQSFVTASISHLSPSLLLTQEQKVLGLASPPSFDDWESVVQRGRREQRVFRFCLNVAGNREEVEEEKVL